MAALQNFIDNQLPTIKAAFLNQVDAFVNTLFNGATTQSQAQTALFTGTPLPIAFGGTGVADSVALRTLINSLAGYTGEFRQFQLTAAPAGWVAGNGGTIGNVGSGATLASATTFDLFSAWWAQYSDAQLPILTSAGGASTRGASALADWNALKRLTVFDVRDRVTRNAGATFVNGTKYATTTQDHNHRLSMGADGSLFYAWLDASNFPVFGSEVVGGARNLNVAGALTGSGGVRLAYTDVMRAPSLSGESAPNAIALLGCYKL